MDAKKTFKTFRYRNEVRWSSGRRGFTSPPGKPGVEISSPPEFRGDPEYWSPEDLFVASVNACTLLTFVAYALREGLDLVAYDSFAEGVLENAGDGYRFTEVALHPRITVRTEEDVDLARTILDSAHMGCLVSRSVRCAVKVLPEIHVG
ncbi:MAG TPA: OsmC family protein [bacterium]|nr:OsmC family protein [bacterium]